MIIADIVNGIQHLGLPAKDIDATVSFYEGLGFSVVFNTADASTGDRVVFLALKNLVIEAYESRETAGKAGAIDHMALDVKDADTVFALVKSGNYNVLDSEVQYLPFWSNGVKFFTIMGPNGEKIEFSQKL